MSRAAPARKAARPEPIAIVGMRGRFPGAPDLDAYWRNLAAGVESIATLSKEEMRAAGVPDRVSRLPGYVNASPVLDAVDEFDAEFFGFSARDAALTDPQHRLFLETCWEALEDAGHDPSTFPGAIGLFGGCELSGYLYQLYQNIDSLPYLDGMQLMVTNDKDHLCTQVSYRLDLRGPSVAVQTTCSTSLVAVSLACESLHSGRCDMALAGGVTVRVPQKGGYFYTAGSILSPDGHCRPFDAGAQGTVVGSGVGLVVLRRLADALRDGDSVRAVILGTGLNNDGSDKVGYAAPSFRGQAAAIRAAHAAAGVGPDSIGYVEAHGTGTILGDPIELAALNDAFGAGTQRRGFCGIGSVKSNVGHLSCAAGIAGLIKTVLVLEQGAIPPTVHYRSPNPAIDFASSPFFVTTRLHPWPRNGVPRRAGVSSFGVGGTNAHVVLEEAPVPAASPARHDGALITVSARSPAALDAASRRLAAHLAAHPEQDLADVAYTLHVGRRAFRHRRALVVAADADGRARAAAELAQPAGVLAEAERRVVFVFPGQGSQYPGMAAGLYKREPVVRRTIDRCARVLDADLGGDLRKLIFAPARRRDKAADELRDTRWAQPALFVVGYALAELWRSWGVAPAAMIGHSVGEYVAAVLAGVMTLEDALRLIARRGQLIARLPRGSMLAVFAAPERLERFVERFVGDGVSVAAINGPSFSVLSGPDAAIAEVESALTGASIAARRLHTSHAFHSTMMEPILGEFEGLVADVPLSPPSIPFAATLTGRWANGDVIRPGYWAAQIRETVRFADAVKTVLAEHGAAGAAPPLLAPPLFLEVGPGNTLSTFVAEMGRAGGAAPVCLASLPGPHDERSDVAVALASLGQLWAHGAAVDWRGVHAHERRRRVSLPSYPFERRSYWIGARRDPSPVEPEATAAPDAADEAPGRDTSAWFHRPALVEEALGAGAAAADLAGRRVLVFDEGTGLGAAVVARLRALGAAPIRVVRGAATGRAGDGEHTLDPSSADGFARLAADVCAGEPRLGGVIDCWSAAPPGGTDLDAAAVVALLAPMRLAAALSGQPTLRPLPVLLAARGTRRVGEGDVVDPPRALGAGVARVLPQEHPGLRLAHIDVDDEPDVAGALVAELGAGAPEPAVALRGGRRLVETFEPVPIPDVGAPLDLPERPVVLITGGLGHMGMTLAQGMFEQWQARLVLIGRAEMPPPEQWAVASQDRTRPAELRGVLARLAWMRAERDDVLALKADMNDPAAVVAAVDEAVGRFGAVDLVVHGAARIDAGAFAPAADTGPDVVEAQFSPKLRGLLHLVAAFRGREPRRWVLHSSISSVLGGLGLGAYAAANAVLDAMAVAGGPRWLSIAWDLWDNAAEAKMAGMPAAIRPVEGIDAFVRLLGAGAGTELGPRVLVAADDLGRRLQAWVRRADAAAEPQGAALQRHPRPNLSTLYVEPRTETERALAEIWAAQLAVASIGVNDRFFDLGGHSLLAVQVASGIRDRFQIELPVLKLFQAPTVAELAVLVDAARASRGGAAAPARADVAQDGAPPAAAAPAPLLGDAPAVEAKTRYREFYDDVSRRLAVAGVAEASFFLNYGYVPRGGGDEARVDVPAGVFNASSVRLVLELVGPVDLGGRRLLDVGCGRGGAASFMAERLGADVTGVDLSPEAIAFCRRAHRHPQVRFEVGDAEHLPFDAARFDVVTNMESSHTYPNLRAFYVEVARVLASGGTFLYTDLLPVQRWNEVRVLLPPLGLRITHDRDITANVLASCDQVAATRAQAFGGNDAAIDNFLAVPGSMVYEQMRSAAWEYRILRAVR
jgi:acyl transferase domain-containing protein/SAM-dependent methyltransferase